MNFSEFEREYLSIRAKEGRLYDDELVKKLPFIDEPEWKIRAASAKRLVQYLKKQNTTSFIEVGCGNGWLTNYLQRTLDATATGIDINLVELRQAERINPKAKFIYGDIFSLKELHADVVILAACIQYFPDLKRLIDTLKQMGDVHIIDSPLYENASAARERSAKYFESKNASGMKAFYFHHELRTVKDAEFLYKPNKLKTLMGDSPFPWIRIRKDSSVSWQSR